MKSLIMSPVEETDIGELQKIYEYYVRYTSITFIEDMY